ncbi:MAG: phospholipase D family protein [Verrucomicrobiales bacterium]
MSLETELIVNAEHYSRVMRQEILKARQFLWLATADIKDLFVEGGPKNQPFRPFLGFLAELIAAGVAVRLIHAKEPGPRFRADFDRFPQLLTNDLFERALCPRMHMKVIIIDGESAYLGSANLTGAGLGAKGENRRNFEAGVFTKDRAIIRRLMDDLDALWLGVPCARCERRPLCPEPLDSLWAAR